MVGLDYGLGYGILKIISFETTLSGYYWLEKARKDTLLPYIMIYVTPQPCLQPTWRLLGQGNFPLGSIIGSKQLCTILFQL